MEAHKIYSNQWTQIAKIIGGRTDNAVKNRWNAISKQQKKSKAAAIGSNAATDASAGDAGAANSKRKLAATAKAQKSSKARTTAYKMDTTSLKIDIPGANLNMNMDSGGLQSVRFSHGEAAVLEMVHEQLGQLTNTTNYRLLSARSAENGESLVPPMGPSPSANAEGFAAGFKTPTLTPFINDPKLHKTISREILALLNQYPSDALVQPATGSAAAASLLDCENPLSSTATERRSAADAAVSNGPSTTSSRDYHRTTCSIIQQAQNAVASANGFYRNMSDVSGADVAHGFSPYIMPATARIMQKLYAWKTGLTPKDVNNDANVKRTNSINFREYMKHQEMQQTTEGMEAEAKRKVAMQTTGNSVTFDVDEQLLSPLTNPNKRRLRRSPRIPVSGLPSRVSSPSVIIGDVGAEIGASSVADLMRLPSDALHQSLENFLPALAMRLPDDPPKELFQVPYIESDYTV